MDHKLTLKLDRSVIERAKRYARKQKTSVSHLIENYLDSITHDEFEKGQISPLVKSLTGVLDLSPERDERAAYSNYLEKKYS